MSLPAASRRGLCSICTTGCAHGERALFADGQLAVPEHGNGVDDLLDEARVEVDFLLSMQVPEGQRLRIATDAGRGKAVTHFEEIDAGGLVHSKVADQAWTGIPTAPAEDRMRRF